MDSRNSANMRLSKHGTRSYVQLTVVLLGLTLWLPTFADSVKTSEPEAETQKAPLDKQEFVHDHPLKNDAGGENTTEAANGGSATVSADSAQTPDVHQAGVTEATKEKQEAPLPTKRNPLALKPGQKLKIAGFAEQKTVNVVEPESSASSPSYHRAQMHLSGSMCFACLHELEEKLLDVYGVERVRIERSEQTSISVYAPVLPNYADAIVFYDASKVDLVDLRAYMRAHGYFPYKVSEKTVSSVPPENQKRI